jgi:hypothetical protein
MKMVFEADLGYYETTQEMVALLKEVTHAMEALLPPQAALRNPLDVTPDKPFRVLMEVIPDELGEKGEIKARVVFMRDKFDTRKHSLSATGPLRFEKDTPPEEMRRTFAESLTKGWLK